MQVRDAQSRQVDAVWVLSNHERWAARGATGLPGLTSTLSYAECWHTWGEAHRCRMAYRDWLQLHAFRVPLPLTHQSERIAHGKA